MIMRNIQDLSGGVEGKGFERLHRRELQKARIMLAAYCTKLDL